MADNAAVTMATMATAARKSRITKDTRIPSGSEMSLMCFPPSPGHYKFATTTGFRCSACERQMPPMPAQHTGSLRWPPDSPIPSDRVLCLECCEQMYPQPRPVNHWYHHGSRDNSSDSHNPFSKYG